MHDSAEERNKAIARAEFAIWSGGELDGLHALVAPDVVHHDPYDPDAAGGLGGLKRSIRRNREAFPDMEITVEDQIAEGDRVATRWRATMTHRGSLIGESPTGNRVVMTGITVERFEDGKIVESWRSMDTLGLLAAIEALPSRT